MLRLVLCELDAPPHTLTHTTSHFIGQLEAKRDEIEDLKRNMADMAEQSAVDGASVPRADYVRGKRLNGGGKRLC